MNRRWWLGVVVLCAVIGGIFLYPRLANNPVSLPYEEIQGGSLPARGNRYATGFELRTTPHGREAIVYSPWKRGDTLAIYSLDTPLTRIGVSACTHIGMLDALDALEQVVGVCNKSLVYTTLPDGITDLGDAMSPAVEKILSNKCDAMFVCRYAAAETTWLSAERLGIPLIYVNEWVEQHPLGRAEWIRFIGAFIGKEQQADSLFAVVADRYETLSLQGQDRAEQQPQIMVGQDFRGTWYVPSGATFMGQLLRDAGASYAYADDLHKGSIPLTTEKALQVFMTADIWVGCQAQSLAQLAQIDEKHTWFHAFQTGRVYNYEGRTTSQGGNDFWERGVVHPDEILEDLQEALYPSGQHTFMYIQHLK